MATWKKVVVSGSAISQLDNDANYITQAGIDFAVDSVNGQTGVVVLPILSASSFTAGAADNSLIITDKAGVTAVVTLASTAADIPVDSVNGLTGVVVLPVMSGSNFTAASADNTLLITEKDGTTTSVTLASTAAPVDSVNGLTGVVVLPVMSGSNFTAGTADNSLLITEKDGTTTSVTLASTAAPVDSVNGQTGTVVLPILSGSSFTAGAANNSLLITAGDGATTSVQLGDAEALVDSVNGLTGVVVLPVMSGSNFTAASADNTLLITEKDGTTTSVTLASTAVDIPVDSVNGQTGVVVLPILSGSSFTAGAADNTLIITDKAGVTEVVTLASTAAPVDSVNGLTGVVVLPVMSGSNFTAASADNTLLITEKDGTTTSVTLASTAAPVDSVNGLTGVVVLPILSASSFTANSSGTGIPQGEIDITDGAGTVTTIDLGLLTTDNVTFNDLNVDGNLVVEGTASFRHSENLDVVDQYITLNSGSGAGGAGADGGGIIIAQDAANDKGEAFAWVDGSTEDVNNKRWGIAGSIPSATTGNITPTAFMASIFKTAASVDTAASILAAAGSAAGSGYNKPGNIYVDPSQGIWMYS